MVIIYNVNNIYLTNLKITNAISRNSIHTRDCPIKKLNKKINVFKFCQAIFKNVLFGLQCRIINKNIYFCFKYE